MNAQAADQSAANRSGGWTVLLVACGLIAGIGLLGVDLAGPALSGHAGSGAMSSQGLIVISCLLAIVLLLRVAHHAEHGLRSHTSIAQSYVGVQRPSTPSEALEEAAPRSMPGPGRVIFGRAYSPLALRGGMVMFVAMAVLFVVLAISNYSKAERSAFVQKHGTSTLATVISVNNRHFCGRYSCYWSATIPVRLSRPVDGVSSTVVSYPQSSSLVSGQRVSVLVDPQQPGYAEFPGAPLKRASSWLFEIMFALASAAIAALQARGFLRVRAHRRDHMAPSTPAAGLASSSAL